MLNTAMLFPMTYSKEQMDSSMDFPRWLNQKMYEQRYNQTTLAKATGLSQGAISHWVRGTRSPDPNTCQRLADVFGVTFAEVLTVAGYPVGSSGGTDPLKIEVSQMIDELTPEGREVLVDYLVLVLKRHRRQ